MKRVLTSWAGASALTVLAALSGCAPIHQSIGTSVRRPDPVVQARIGARAADRERNVLQASGLSLAALRLAQSENSAEARAVANLALARFITLNFQQSHLLVRTFTGSDALTYRVRMDFRHGDWPSGLINHLQPISPARTQEPASLVWNGWGVPMIGVCKPDRNKEPFAPRQGYRLPVTVVATMQPRPQNTCNTTIRFLNPDVEKTVRLDGKMHPVAGNLLAPNIATFRLGNPLIQGLRWLIAVDRFSYPTNLIFIQPYDPDRIPVILVHGLLSTQAIWRGVLQGLESDPLLRKKYQFWCFLYPTGQPIPLSALELRRDLRSAETRYHPSRGIVLVGHSMGGILSRAQTSSSGGHAIVNSVFGQDAPRILARLPDTPLLRDSLIFDRDRNVRRVVFICVPHRGSSIASMGPVALFTRLIRLPNTVADNISGVSHIATSINLRRLPTSICGLSPRSAFLRALDQRPIEVPHHSILGDRGRGDSPNSSDGVVPYASAHLASAESELIVPCGHSAFSHPAAIEELKRILQQHLNSLHSSHRSGKERISH